MVVPKSIIKVTVVDFGFKDFKIIFWGMKLMFVIYLKNLYLSKNLIFFHPI